jgi:prepilin peptidase CpaA
MPLSAPVASQGVLIITAAVLFYVALADFKHYKIRNEVVLILAGLFFVHALLSGRWTSLHWNLGFAALLFAIMLHYYSMKLMGGGDLKLLTVAFLWVGPFCAIPFAIFLLFFVGIHTLAVKLKWVEVKVAENLNWIPFAPSIAAALIGVFMAGCLRPI